jgi:hypothetical protein
LIEKMSEPNEKLRFLFVEAWLLALRIDSIVLAYKL